NPAIGGFVLNMRDVSERKSLEQQLRYQALHDPLTKLANRTRFADRLAHALLRAGRTGCRVAVLFMDLDNFKGVNDSLGHSAGDLLLTDVAERIEACLRPGDTVARRGGSSRACRRRLSWRARSCSCGPASASPSAAPAAMRRTPTRCCATRTWR